MTQKIAALCYKCGPVYPDPLRTVVYASPGSPRSRKYRLGYRCPKCDDLIVWTTSKENATAASESGSVALWGDTHPAEVLERIVQARSLGPYTWDEYLDGYRARAES